MSGSSEGAGPALPRLHLVTDESIIRGDGFSGQVSALADAFGPRIAIHLRGGTLGGRVFFEVAESCAPLAQERGTFLVINDRVDVALCCGVPAIQLPRHSLSIQDARRLVGQGVAIGVSVHTPEESARAVTEGADFLLAGTVFSTPSHPGRTGRGVGWLGGLAALGRPVIAIGGITAERAVEVMRTGVHGVAVIRAVWNAPDPIAAVDELLRALEDWRE